MVKSNNIIISSSVVPKKHAEKEEEEEEGKERVKHSKNSKEGHTPKCYRAASLKLFPFQLDRFTAHASMHLLSNSTRSSSLTLAEFTIYC